MRVLVGIQAKFVHIMAGKRKKDETAAVATPKKKQIVQEAKPEKAEVKKTGEEEDFPRGMCLCLFFFVGCHYCQVDHTVLVELCSFVKDEDEDVFTKLQT